MKKLVMLLIMVAATAQCVDAQAVRNSRYYNPRTGHLDYGNRNRGLSSFGLSGLSTDQYIGFRVGPAFTHVASDDLYLGGGGEQTGWNIGFVYGKALSYSAPLYFETGLYYTEKGGKSESDGSKFTYDLDYLDIPLTVKYVWHPDEYEPNGLTVQPFLGMYVGCGIAGKIKNFQSREAYESFSDDGYNFRRLDAGLKLGCGVGYDMFYAELAYELGLANVSHDSFDDAHNHALMLNIGVNF